MMLEVLSRKARSGPPRTPILFVHGAYVGAWCWEENFLDWFAGRGFPSYAVSLRGHGRSAGREHLNDFGLADYAEDVARAAAQLPGPPVLIGHSMGALVVQKYLEAEADHSTAAAVLACPVPSFGLLPSTFALAWTRPVLFAGINGLAAGGSVSPEILAEAMFAGTIEQGKLERHHRRMQRESRRALMDMSGWALPQLWRQRRTNMLVLGASHDALISPLLAQSTASLLGAEYRLLVGLGHALMLDAGWQCAAEAIADWLGEQGF